MRYVIITAAMLCLSSIGTLDLYGQQLSSGGIHATGSVELERPAERLRLRIQLMVRSAEDMKDAVKQLKARRTEVEEKLTTLGVEKKSIKFGNPHVYDEQNGFLSGFGGFAPAVAFPRVGVDFNVALPPGSRVVPGKQEQQPIKLAMKLTADWILKSKDPAELLVEVTKLEDAIKNADLSGFEDDEDLADDTEDDEEGPFMFGPGGIQVNRKPGDPEFQYVASIPDTDYKQALRDAFQNARKDAEDLASVANVQLDAVSNLRTTRHALNEGNGEFGEDSYYHVADDEDFGFPVREIEDQDSLEMIGATPGMLKYRVAVVVTYSLKSRLK